jgi:hypothetical protein
VLPDALLGCSAGALNAAFLASEPSVLLARALADWWSDSGSRRVLAPARWSQVRGVVSAVASRPDALHDERPLRVLMSTHVGAHDASCSLPGLFPPVRLSDGHLHVDGGVVCGVRRASATRQSGSGAAACTTVRLPRTLLKPRWNAELASGSSRSEMNHVSHWIRSRVTSTSE